MAKELEESGVFDDEGDASEAAELVLYQVSECYVYLVFPFPFFSISMLSI